MEPRFLADSHFVMSRLPSLTFAGLALLLLAAVPVRADEPAAAAPAEAAAAPAEAVPRRRAGGRDSSEPPLVVDPTAWREPSSPSRPAKRWSTSAEVDSNSYRVSLSRGKLDLGLGFDAPVGRRHADRAQRRSGRADRSHRAFAQHRPAQRHRRRAAEQPDRARQRRRHDAPSSTRRVGLEWKPAQSSVFVRGGVRLTGDDRVTMRLRSGRVGVYMKSTF